jgi:hypothetical protein
MTPSKKSQAGSQQKRGQTLTRVPGETLGLISHVTLLPPGVRIKTRPSKLASSARKTSNSPK